MGVLLEVAGLASGQGLAVRTDDEILDRMMLLADSEGALLLRIGEILAALSDFDERLLGHTSYRGLLQNEVDFDRSWAIRLRNFARSQLVAIKVAVCRNIIPMSAAVEAPTDLTLEGQLAWIEGVRSGDIRTKKKKKKSKREPRVLIDDSEAARIVHAATKRARTIRGGNCSDAAARRDIRKAFHDKADGREIIRKALEPREPRPKEPPIDWNAITDPAAELLGPRRVPIDVHDGRRILRELLYDYRIRTIELGLLYQQVVDRKLYRVFNFGSIEEMVRESFTVSVRTLQNYRDRALDLAIYPELLQALEQGMDFGRVMAVCEVATEDNVDRWLAIAKRMTVMELRRAVSWAHETEGELVLSSYENAIAETKGAHQWVAIRAARREERPPRWIEGAEPDLVEACKWYLENVRIPKQHGFQEVKERASWICENPRCYCLTIRMDSHHRLWRSRGGTNESSNGRAVCKPCHLRGIHPHEVVRIDADEKGRDVWSYADGLQIVVL
jgi:hypothetical protein